MQRRVNFSRHAAVSPIRLGCLRGLLNKGYATKTPPIQCVANIANASRIITGTPSNNRRAAQVSANGDTQVSR